MLCRPVVRLRTNHTLGGAGVLGASLSNARPCGRTLADEPQRRPRTFADSLIPPSPRETPLDPGGFRFVCSAKLAANTKGRKTRSPRTPQVSFTSHDTFRLPPASRRWLRRSSHPGLATRMGFPTTRCLLTAPFGLPLDTTGPQSSHHRRGVTLVVQRLSLEPSRSPSRVPG